MNVHSARASLTAGFSLVEMVLALGILAVAVVPLMGLLPVGMTTFRKAIDAAIATQISQQIFSEAQQTDFDSLPGVASRVRYFDGDGMEVMGSGPSSRVLYHVRVAVKSSPTLPGASDGNENLATLVVQIANNPGNLPLTVDSSSDLWSVSAAQSIPITSYSAVLAGSASSVN